MRAAPVLLRSLPVLLFALTGCVSSTGPSSGPNLRLAVHDAEARVELDAVPRARDLPDHEVVELPGSSRNTRTVTVDLEPITGAKRTVDVVYDVDAVTRPLAYGDVRHQPEWVVGTRLLLGEVGIGRLNASKWSVVEGVGILQTVDNRLDPAVSNPLGVPGIKPFPGCGADGSFQACVNKQEYLGIGTQQALAPRKAASEADVLAAVDRAVTAWQVFDGGYLGDITDGATSFVHRCGGAAYGRPTTSCDGRGSDARGANPHTGPVVFKGPGAFSKRKGCYDMEIYGSVDFEPGDSPTEERAVADYLGIDDDALVMAEYDGRK